MIHPAEQRGGGRGEPAVPTAFRRGRALVASVVAGSAVCWLRDVVGKLPWFDLHGGSSIFGGGIILGLLCWSALRGGRLGGGFFILIYSLLFFACVVDRTNQFLCWLFPVDAGFHFRLGFASADQSFGEALASDAAAVWVVFSLWVLLWSRSARVYREVRRRHVATQEANAFEWPPAHRS